MNTSKIHHFGLIRQYNNLQSELNNAIHNVLKDGILMDGHYTTTFESWLAQKTKTQYAITVHSGTQALEIISKWLKNISTNNNDNELKVFIPNLTYVATLNAFILSNYNIELTDTDENGIINNYHIGALKQNEYVCTVGLYGAKPKLHVQNNHVIVDGAQHWTNADGEIGCAMAISFDPTKNLPNYGNGGAIVTNNRSLYEFALNYRNNGKNSNYTISGSNSRMSEIDCAQLLVKTNYLQSWQDRRKQIRKYYIEQFKNIPIRCLSKNATDTSDQKFVIYLEDRDRMYNHLLFRNIEAKIHYKNSLGELVISKSYKKPDLMGMSVLLSRGVLSLPIYPELTDSEIEYIAKTVTSFFD